jgi:chromatin modification-related protein YNG2
VKLADRMERIVARARERARAEWVKVGGLDIEELGGGGEWENGSVGGEIVLPPSGLGSGSDVRQKSKSSPPQRCLVGGTLIGHHTTGCTS